METKEKKLAQVDELVTNLGLTRDEVVDYLTKLPPVEKKKISKIGTNIVKTTKSVTEEDIFNDIKNIIKANKRQKKAYCPASSPPGQ